MTNIKHRKITAIIQARCGSTRLPGKVLLPLRGQSIVAHVINQAAHAKNIDEIIVATTTLTADDTLCDHLAELSIPVFRGSENDVLDRYYQCAKKYGSSDIVRITADCPFLDPQTVDLIIAAYQHDAFDYCANTDPPTFPDGLDTEVLSFSALEKSWREAKLQSEREHVTQYIKKHPEFFRKNNITHTENLEHHRWTVDNAEDYEYVKALALYMPQDKTPVSMKIVLEAVEKLRQENPCLLQVNGHIERDEGLRRSLEKDKTVRQT